MRVYGLIPARLQSSRLPRKLLLSETGKPLLQYTWEAACRATSLAGVIIATDSPEIVDAVSEFGGRCELTGEHPSGTDRIAEVVRRSCLDADAVVNIQGDEPEIDPSNIDAVVAALAADPNSEMATLATPILDRRQLEDPSCTKVVIAEDGRALYFSRLPIPFCRDQSVDDVLPTNILTTAPETSESRHGAAGPNELPGRLTGESPWLLHLGIYAYRRDFLLKLTELPPSRLERLEKLEQLRALEVGATIQVATVTDRSVGIDTADDYARFVERRRQDAA